MEKISMEKAIAMASNPEVIVYMVQRVYGDTTVEELSSAEGFYVRTGRSTEAPKEAKSQKQAGASKVDHGRIVALYQANPPRSVSWIADDIGVSVQTVINHLKKEGIYEPSKKEEQG